MLTTTSTYALIAMSTMVRNEDRLPITAHELAELGDIPANYLSKIMRQLVRAGLVEGTRGIGGGFHFARPPSKIRLIEVVDSFEEVDRPRVCPFGNHVCDDDHACAVHDLWGGVRNTFLAVLTDTDLKTAATEPKGKRRATSKGKKKRKSSRATRTSTKARRKTRRW